MFNFSNRKSRRTAGRIATLSVEKVTQQALNPQEYVTASGYQWLQHFFFKFHFINNSFLSSSLPSSRATSPVLQTIWTYSLPGALFPACSFAILHHLPYTQLAKRIWNTQNLSICSRWLPVTFADTKTTQYYIKTLWGSGSSLSVQLFPSHPLCPSHP